MLSWTSLRFPDSSPSSVSARGPNALISCEDLERYIAGRRGVGAPGGTVVKVGTDHGAQLHG